MEHKMDDESSNLDDIWSILQDPFGQPCDLRLQDLSYITNDFSSERELGRGGFGVVYKGVLPNGRAIAVKNLLSVSEVHEKQFKNEIDNLVKAKHQNIVRFLGYCYESWLKYTKYNGRPVFAERPKMLLCFEYMPKGSLDKYITEECCGLDWNKRYKIIKGICRGLHYLHEECETNGSIIHLDLKPANILLDDDMMPKIADFGLSRLFAEKKTHTYATSPAGSLGYMAPEYLCRGTISPEADIYGMGVIIIEVITGHHIDPFSNVTGFIAPVLRNWRKRLEAAPSYPSLEIDIQQIERCLEIGISCIKFDRLERPTTGEIIKRLDISELTNRYITDEGPSADKIKSAPKELLEITPPELCFSSDINRRVPCLVKTVNKTDYTVAFHFGVASERTNYIIEPSSGYLWPGATLNIVVTVQEHDELPLDWQCKDELVVQSVVMGKYHLISKPVTVDMFNNMPSNLANNVKLSVVYVPEAGLSPLAPLSLSGLDSIADQAETKATDSQPLEAFLVQLMRHQIQREVEKKGDPDVDILSIVEDIMAQIEYAQPKYQQSHDHPESLPTKRLGNDDLDLLTVILQCAEKSGLPKSVITKIIRSELTEGLKNIESPDSPRSFYSDCLSSDETESSFELPLPTRLQKLASQKSGYVHTDEEEMKTTQEEQEMQLHEDARVDDFIKKFREQLRLQRL